MIANLDRVNRPDLELPLADHDLSVGARYRKSCLHAGPGVVLNDVTTPDLVCTDSAVIATLGCRESTDRPPVWAPILVERVLLLQPEPWLLVAVLLKSFHSRCSRVRYMRRHVRVENLAHDQDVIATAYRIGNDLDRVKHTVGVLPWRLLGG